MTGRHEVLAHVVRSIAEVDDCSPHDLGYALYDHVETDALRTLVASEHTDWEITFDVPDHTVTVRGTGQILVDGTVVRDFDGQFEQIE